MGSWFREYVYIPLGGNRVPVIKHLRNLLIVWFLTGLWHGAAWNFVAWGLYYGFILILEKYFLGRVLERLPAVVRHIYSLVLVLIGWAFFFSPTLGGAVDYIQLMFGVGANGLVDSEGLYLLTTNLLLLILLVIGSTPIVHRAYERVMAGRGKILANCVVYAAMFLLCIAYLVTETYNPFLYFRF